MVEVIYPNGETLPMEMKGKKPTLKEMQDIVEGYIEVVSTNDGRLMVINEEGKLKNLEPNHVATELFVPGMDIIVGNAIVMNKEEME